MHNNWGWSYSWFSAHDEVRRKGAPPAGPEDKAWLVITFVLGVVAVATLSSGNGGGAVLGVMAILVIVKATIDLFK